MTILFLAAMSLSGVALWRRLARGGLHPLREDETSRYGVAIFLAMLLLASLAGVAAQAGERGLEDASLHDILALQALTYGLAIAAVLAVGKRCGVSLGSLGMWPSEGPSAAKLALAAWLAAYPLVLLASWLNQALVPADMEQLQEYLRRFMAEDGAANDPIIWLSIVVVLPIAEEIMFRGALYGGLRRTLPPWVAMLLTGLLFGALHDGATVLPVAALGVLLAWLYERTGNLAAPCLVHCLHNGVTLAITVLPTLLPEASP